MQNVDFTTAAEEDLIGLWLYTHETWGIDQAETYYDQIVSCCGTIGIGKARSKPVEGLTDNVHVHRCAQHYIFFLPYERAIILAILHGRMEFVARLKGRL